MLSRDELILSSGTVGNPPLAVLLEAAVAGGYTSLALWPTDYQQWRADGATDAQAAARIIDRGLSVAQLDCLLRWTARPERAAAEAAVLFDVAGALGAGCVSVIGPGTDRHSVTQLAEMLSGVCDRGAERGLDIAFEVAPWKGNVDLASAVQLLEQTDRPNAGLVVDSWHMFRGSVPLSELSALPGAYVTSIQISDAPLEGSPDLMAETMAARLVPGDGGLDLDAFVRALDEVADGVALTVEVLSDDLRGAGPIVAARRAADATRQLLGRLDGA